MNTAKVPGLLDVVFDLDNPHNLTVLHLSSLARLHQRQPLDVEFLRRIGQRFRPSGIPRTAPRDVGSFLYLCIEESSRKSLVEESLPTVADLDHTLSLLQLVSFANWVGLGLTIRENRYFHQLQGLAGFSELRAVELAKQDLVTPAYVCKVQTHFRRKLQIAAGVSVRTPYELGQILQSRHR